MSLEDLTKLWTRLGALVALFSINSLLIAVKAKAFLPFEMLDDRQAPAILFGILLGCPLLLGLLRVGEAYQRQTIGQSWVLRLPAAGVAKLEPDSRDAHAYQRACAFAFVGLPLLIIIWLEIRLLQLPVYDRVANELISQFDPRLLLNPAALADAGARFRLETTDGVTFLPLVEPVLTAALVGWASWKAWRWWRELFVTAPTEA